MWFKQGDTGQKIVFQKTLNNSKDVILNIFPEPKQQTKVPGKNQRMLEIELKSLMMNPCMNNMYCSGQ